MLGEKKTFGDEEEGAHAVSPGVQERRKIRGKAAGAQKECGEREKALSETKKTKRKK